MHQETFELNCSRTSLAMDGTLVVVVEMSLSTWLVCAEVPGLERRAMMKPNFCHSCTVGAMRLRKGSTAGSLAFALRDSGLRGTVRGHKCSGLRL